MLSDDERTEEFPTFAALLEGGAVMFAAIVYAQQAWTPFFSELIRRNDLWTIPVVTIGLWTALTVWAGSAIALLPINQGAFTMLAGIATLGWRGHPAATSDERPATTRAGPEPLRSDAGALDHEEDRLFVASIIDDAARHGAQLKTNRDVEEDHR